MGYQREMSARQKALDLVKKRDAIEAEMDSIFATLTSDNGPGLSGNLIDSDGFPRADIDIHAIRTQRNRFATLKTDHAKISADVEKYLHIALAPINGNPSSANDNSPTSPVPVTTRPTQPIMQPAPPRPPPPTRQAFALLDELTPGSPAAEAGLHVGDRVVSFGAVSLRAFATPQLAMAALPGLLREHCGQRVDVVVVRGEGRERRVVTLALTPRQWNGPGLLGCHVVPVDVPQVDARFAPEVATAVLEHSAASRTV